MTMRQGYTTGTCAAAAARAAVLLLLGKPVPGAVEVILPDRARVRLPVDSSRVCGSFAEATVLKDAGDDPDITNGLPITVRASWNRCGEVILKAGEGIGTVTKPGLQVRPGEPAINPVPAVMIRSAVRRLTGRGVDITISIPGGRELAARTFNPRLGIAGGLSVLGTTGRVRPFSCSAVRQTIGCCMDIARACGIDRPVLVPGHIGEKAARRHFSLKPEQVIEVSNEWGHALDILPDHRFPAVLILGHPGKLAKLAQRSFDTHSSRSASALPLVRDLGHDISGQRIPDVPTVEGVFSALGSRDRKRLGNALAAAVRSAAASRLKAAMPVAVLLVDMKGSRLGAAGDLSPWEKP
jgi:cobalt-precorrin-5B (C1)-methyltransferase